MNSRSPQNKLAFSSDTNPIQRKFAVPVDGRNGGGRLDSDLVKNTKYQFRDTEVKKSPEHTFTYQKTREKKESQQIASPSNQNFGNQNFKQIQRYQKVKEIAEELSKPTLKTQTSQKVDQQAINALEFQRQKKNDKDEKTENSNYYVSQMNQSKDITLENKLQNNKKSAYNAVPMKKETLRRESSQLQRENQPKQEKQERQERQSKQPVNTIKTIQQKIVNQPPSDLKITKTPQKNQAKTLAKFKSEQLIKVPLKKEEEEDRFQSAKQLQLSKPQGNQYVNKYIQTENKRQQLMNKYVNLQTIEVSLRSEIELLKAKNMQLQSQAKQYQEISLSTTIETNQKLSQHENFFAETQRRYEQSQKKLQEKKKQCEELQRKNEEMRIHCQNIQNIARLKEDTDKRHKDDIQRLIYLHQVNVGKATLAAKDRIIELEQEIINIKSNPERANYQELEKIEKMKKQSYQKTKVIKQQEKQIQLLNEQMNVKLEMEIALVSNIKEKESIYAEVNRLSSLLDKQATSKSELIKKYEMNLLQKQHQIQTLETSLKISKQQAKNINFSDKFASKSSNSEQHQSFEDSIQEMIKQHSKQVSDLKKEISLKQQQAYKWKAENEDLKSRYRRLEQEVTMLKMATNSNIENINQVKNSSEQILKAEVANSKRKTDIIQMKVKDLQAEIKQKDTFIQKVLMGMAKDGKAEDVLTKLQEILSKK